MGKEIEQIALSRGHKIVLKVDVTNAATYTIDELKKADAAIEFSLFISSPHIVRNEVIMYSLRRLVSVSSSVSAGISAFSKASEKLLLLFWGLL